MKYRAEDGVFQLSIKELCESALRPVDLDLRIAGARETDSAAAGREAHRAWQSKADPADRAEVPVCAVVTYSGKQLEIRGRADLIRAGEIPVVEEIKTVSGRPDGEPSAFHEAQAKVTAWIWLLQNQLSRVVVRMTRIRRDDGRSDFREEACSREELEAFCFSLLERILYRVSITEERYRVLLPSVGTGRFPYASVREAQDIMLKECYRDLKLGKRLFVQAPTGTGKTISALYPAVRVLGEGHADRIFYLTAKNSTAREAYRAAGDIFRAGSHLRTLMMTSREQLCVNRAARTDPAGISRHCNPEECPRAKGFYDRCGQAVCDLLARQSGYPRKEISETADRFGICPYEFQLELSEFCDVIICDYNYVFDPAVYLRRYFEENAPLAGRFLFLIDEAHNLADRACAMYSAEWNSEPIRESLSALAAANGEEPSAKDAGNALSALLNAVPPLRELCRETSFRDGDGIEHGFYLNRSPLPSFAKALSECREALEKWCRSRRQSPLLPILLPLIGKLKHFELIHNHYDEHFTTFVEFHGESVTVREICLDPSELLHEKLSLAHAAVLFSATLTPTDYFIDILGGGKNAIPLSLPSPFDSANLCVAAFTGVSTRFEEREKSFRKIASVIAATVSAKQGNYIVYFPSYDYLERVYAAFRERYDGVTVLAQEKGMTREGREAFLDAFRDDGKLRVGFCVLGGSFSEGVDLPGGKLIGTVIVGVGLPGLSNERNLLRDYYEVTRERGYDYAYTYPGMNRVLQAAGRVIRREDDRGIVVLVDERYSEPRYTELFPEQWDQVQFAKKPKELANIAFDFWKKHI